MSSLHAMQNCPTEWAYSSGSAYADPFNDIDLDVIFVDPTGVEVRVPAYWAGDQTWGVRFAPHVTGTYRYYTACSDPENRDLHGREGTLAVAPYGGTNPLFRHGPLEVSDDRRYLQHRDGTPFFWLADTWWRSLSARLRWPDEFRALTADRVAKGFNVVQIVMGLNPGEFEFDERGANEAGLAWEAGYSRINPSYFGMADLRIESLVRSGVVPCLFSAWGFHVHWLGIARLKQHWRYLIARYGAFPVVWCLAGELRMPYYLSTDRAGDSSVQKRAWSEIARYVRATDPYRHPLTAHPIATAASRDELEGPALVDFDMLQTGHHDDRDAIPATIEQVVRSVGQQPRVPVINAEVCYEGIHGMNREEIQRFMFWTCVLSGTCGHTYGADGIILINTREQPFGTHPFGFSQGEVPWEEAAQYPGAAQVGLGRRLLERYPWWCFEPHPEWVEPHWTLENYRQAYAAGISDQVRIVYFPSDRVFWHGSHHFATITNLEADAVWEAFFFDPTNGRAFPRMQVARDATGRWPVPKPPIRRDWILVLERREVKKPTADREVTATKRSPGAGNTENQQP